MSADERRLALLWHTEDGMSPLAIATLLRRDKSTLTRFLVKKHVGKGRGRAKLLSPGAIAELVAHLEQLIKEADRQYEVTLRDLKEHSGCAASQKTIQRALHSLNIYFRPLRQKPLLTAEDVAARKTFADTYASKRAAWWLQHIHLHIDVKHFPVLLHHEARRRGASEGVRGAYRAPGQGLEAPYVKADRRMKFNPGARGVSVLAGVGQRKVLLWEYIDGHPWNSNTAAAMYVGPVAAALRKAYPNKRKWTVLEDNDPAGFKSRKGMAAKAAVGIQTFDLPKRSPALNVCDYALWAEVNRRMRRQERSWPAGRRETRRSFLSRLRRTALGLPTGFVQRSILNMKKRCQRLQAVEGGLFEEGGL